MRAFLYTTIMRNNKMMSYVDQHAHNTNGMESTFCVFRNNMNFFGKKKRKK